MSDDDIIKRVTRNLGTHPGGMFSINPNQLGMTGEQFDALARRLIAADGGDGFSVVAEGDHKQVYTQVGYQYRLLWLRRDS